MIFSFSSLALDIGYLPFIGVKIAVGGGGNGVMALGNLRLAKFGLSVVLTIYIGLMDFHF